MDITTWELQHTPSFTVKIAFCSNNVIINNNANKLNAKIVLEDLIPIPL